jgi:hypothetical protein
LKKYGKKKREKKVRGKKYGKKSTGTKVRGIKVREKNRTEKKYGGKSTKKKYGKKVRKKSTGKKVRPDRASSGHMTVTSGEKVPTRADIAQLPVAHAQIILPNRAASGHVTDVTSGQACARYHFR